MATTPIYGWPYQSLTDAPNGADLGEDLALGIEATVATLAGLVTTLQSDVTALQNVPHLTRLDETTLGGTASSVTFGSIPATYRALQLSVICRGDDAAQFVDCRLRFNNDSSANYDSEQVTGAAAVAAAFEGLSETGINLGEMPGSTPIAGSVSARTVFIPFYAGTTFWKLATTSHNLSSQTSGGQAGQQHSKHWAGRWRSTAAISSVTILAGAGDFIAGSSFVLYGLP